MRVTRASVTKDASSLMMHVGQEQKASNAPFDPSGSAVGEIFSQAALRVITDDHNGQIIVWMWVVIAITAKMISRGSCFYCCIGPRVVVGCLTS